MPPKKTQPVAAGASKIPPVAAPSKSSHQRTLTNKQQQLCKISSDRVALLNFFSFIVAQRNEKEMAAKQRALTDAIWLEQRIEEINGFHKKKLPGNVISMLYFYS